MQKAQHERCAYESHLVLEGVEEMQLAAWVCISRTALAKLASIRSYCTSLLLGRHLVHVLGGFSPCWTRH